MSSYLEDPETNIVAPDVSDQEAKKFLDDIGAQRPFGSKKLAGMKAVLAIVAKDVEMRAFYGLPSYKMTPEASKMLIQMIGASSFSVERATKSFADPRFEAAQARFATAPVSARPLAPKP